MHTSSLIYVHLLFNFFQTTGEEEDQMEEGEGNESAELDISADQSENKRKSANDDVDDDLDESEAKRTKQSESDE